LPAAFADMSILKDRPVILNTLCSFVLCMDALFGLVLD
jgi:hypothetical protein